MAHQWSSRVWLTSGDFGPDEERTEDDRPGAYVICDACDAQHGPTATALAVQLEEAFVAELQRRGYVDGTPIPADLSGTDEPGDDFDDWPDVLALEHEDDCPIGFALALTRSAPRTLTQEEIDLVAGIDERTLEAREAGRKVDAIRVSRTGPLAGYRRVMTQHAGEIPLRLSEDLGPEQFELVCGPVSQRFGGP